MKQIEIGDGYRNINKEELKRGFLCGFSVLEMRQGQKMQMSEQVCTF